MTLVYISKKKSRFTGLGVLIFLCFSVSVFAQGNPFISPSGIDDKEATEEKPETEEEKKPFTLRTSIPKGRATLFVYYIARVQRDVRAELGDIMADFKERSSFSSLFILLGLSFLYGFAHALGPGHRKTVVAAYFFSRKSNIVHGVIAGNGLAFLHAGSAVILIVLLYYGTTRSVLASYEGANQLIEMISYIAILVIGLFLFIKKVKSIKKESKSKNDKTMGPVILATGLVPCPGAAAIMLFSISMDIIWLGVLAVFVMSAGMAFTLILIAVGTIILKNKSTSFVLAGKNPKRGAGFLKGLELASSILLVLFASFMLLPHLVPYV